MFCFQVETFLMLSKNELFLSAFTEFHHAVKLFIEEMFVLLFTNLNCRGRLSFGLQTAFQLF